MSNDEVWMIVAGVSVAMYLYVLLQLKTLRNDIQRKENSEALMDIDLSDTDYLVKYPGGLDQS